MFEDIRHRNQIQALNTSTTLFSGQCSRASDMARKQTTIPEHIHNTSQCAVFEDVRHGQELDPKPRDTSATLFCRQCSRVSDMARKQTTRPELIRNTAQYEVFEDVRHGQELDLKPMNISTTLLSM